MLVLVKYLQALQQEGIHVDKLTIWYMDILAYVDCKDTVLSKLLTTLILDLCRIDESFLTLCVQLYFQTMSRNAATILTQVDASRATVSVRRCLFHFHVLFSTFSFSNFIFYYCIYILL